MPPSFERYIALRYLKGAHVITEGRRFLRLITFISVGGVAVGVTALILALSIVRGFSQEIEAKIIGFGAHIQVENFRDAPLTGSGLLKKQLAANADVRRIAPVVQEFVLLRRSRTQIDGVSIWGTDQLPEYLSSSLSEGSSDFSRDEDELYGMVVGKKLAETLGLAIGDRITAFSLRNRGGGSLTARTPKVKQFRISGIYETFLANFDELYVFTETDAARELLSYRMDEVTRYDLLVRDNADPRIVAEQLDAGLEFPVMARSIHDVYRSLFAWVNLQESIIPLVIAIIVFVAAFNIVGTLLMIILEKTREVGILSSMGASKTSLKRLFLMLGLHIGLAGVVIGESVSLVLAWIQLRFSVIPLPEEAYYMDTVPIQLSYLDFVLVAVVTLALCAASSYIPARFAARIEPIRAIHLR